MYEIGEFDYLIELIEKHCITKLVDPKGAELYPLDHEKAAKAAKQLFLLFPREDTPSRGKKRVEVIQERVRSLIEDGYSETEFKTLCRIVEVLYRNWTQSQNSKKGKYTIGAVRSRHPRIYEHIMTAQNGRCVFCGYLFTENGDQHLDHIIPYNLGGDEPNSGSNWQILCKSCNRAKGDLLTVLQYQDRQDWIYRLRNWFPESETRENKERFRLIALVRDGSCMGCGGTPSETELRTINQTNGLSIPSNLDVVCAAYSGCEPL